MNNMLNVFKGNNKDLFKRPRYDAFFVKYEPFQHIYQVGLLITLNT